MFPKNGEAKPKIAHRQLLNLTLIYQSINLCEEAVLWIENKSDSLSREQAKPGPMCVF